MRILFCEGCRIRNDWVAPMVVEIGQCLVCGATGRCHKSPSSTLPFMRDVKIYAEVGPSCQNGEASRCILHLGSRQWVVGPTLSGPNNWSEVNAVLIWKILSHWPYATIHYGRDGEAEMLLLCHKGPQLMNISFLYDDYGEPAAEIQAINNLLYKYCRFMHPEGYNYDPRDSTVRASWFAEARQARP